ncbi:hypothetical protein MSEN_36860 [Mycolicibacter senuensis]|uniref:Uncharacterized protein n=1 Tax=Mycolicibacter senuensis TaxID=386913 RepID=A0A7I9XRJ2_9MYCO|nr:hypothetical protein MSEN_36860 [Mycolicibacter senuensis]
MQGDGGTRAALTDAGLGVLALVEVAHRQHHQGAPRRKRSGGFEAEAGVGSGDDGDTAGLVRDVGGCPLGHVTLLSCGKVNGADAPVSCNYTERTPRFVNR